MTSSKKISAPVYGMSGKQALETIRALLAENALPATDIDGHIEHFVTAHDGDRLVGVIGIEVHGDDGLLRSLCVNPRYRKRGIAKRLCELAESHARNVGLLSLFLLTNTAEAFFAVRGFKSIAREQVPPAIGRTEEFRSLCPASAVCMTRSLPSGALYLPAPLLPLRPDVPGARMWAAGLNNTMLTYFEVDPHTRFEIHLHEGEQITSVIEGELFFELEGNTLRIGAGEVLAIPPGVPHAVFTAQVGAKAFDAWSPPLRRS